MLLTSVVDVYPESLLPGTDYQKAAAVLLLIPLSFFPGPFLLSYTKQKD